MSLAQIVDNTSAEAKLVENSEKPGGVALVHAFRATKTACPLDLVELAQVVQRGDEGVRSTACNKLTTIAEQIKFLQDQAKRVLEKAKLDSELHHAASNIAKKPGQIYYLYQKQSGQKFISIISPSEWGNSKPGVFHGGYRLEIDRSWTPLDEIKEKDKESHILNAVLYNNQGLLKAIGD